MWSPALTGFSEYRMRQHVSSVVLGSSTVAWCNYITLSCTGCMFRYVFSISLEWSSTSVFKGKCPSTLWTAAHVLWMLPAVSMVTLPATTSSLFHNIVTASLVVWNFQLLAWRPGTLCPTISVTQHLVMTSLEQHCKHTFFQVSEHVAH